MIHLDLSRAMSLDTLERTADSAARKLDGPGWESVAALWREIGNAAKRERERRSGPGVRHFPLTIDWPPELPHKQGDLALELALSSVAKVSSLSDSRDVSRVLGDLAVSIAELRDQRRAERRAFYNLAGRLAAGGPPDAA